MHVRRRGPVRAALLAAAAITASGAMILSGLTAAPTARAAEPPSPAPMEQRDDAVVTADALPTVQIDSGYVWAQTMIGDTVYSVGSFSNARAPLAAPGTSLTPRQNILAFDIRSGALSSFAPQVNGVIRAVAASPDGSRLYIGGTFSSVNGQSRWNFAALDAVTGALVPGFAPSIGGTGVYGITAMADSVYVGGLFTQANGTARSNLAAFASANGALRPWAPTTDLQVDALVTEPGGAHIVAGGRFSRVNGAVQRGLVALEPTSGAINTGWQAPYTVVNGWGSGGSAGKAGIFALATDGSGIYGTGWVFADANVGNLEGVFAADAGSGAIRWVADCHGDHYGVFSTGETVYATGHTHACDTVDLWPEQNPRQYRYVEAFTADARGTLTRSPSTGSTYASWEGTPSPSAYTWWPDFSVGTASGLGQAGLSITGTDGYIAVAGEFTSVNNQRHQGIVRFAVDPPGGAKDGPRIAASAWGAPTAVSSVAGRVRVAIAANWDRDDRDLTYELLREGRSEPVTSVTRRSGWWDRPPILLTETGLPPGSAHTYRVRAVDGDGNAVTSQPATVTVASGVASAYADAVLDDGAVLYYPMGSIRTDWAGGAAPMFGSGATNRSPGAVAGATGTTASDFDGTTSGIVSSSRTSASTAFSVELWFQTTTNRGGKLVGFGSSQTGSSGSYDRHVYMQNDGRLTFGVYPGATRTITSGSAYNDGSWHHMVATQGSDGIVLYVDGAEVARDGSVRSAQDYQGHWRIGGDNLGGWPASPGSVYFSGALDESAVYGSALSAAQVAQHYATGLGFTAPAAAFSATATDLGVALDASGTAPADGATIEAYEWDFGDGAPEASGVTTTHTYASPGTYTVTLTATDSRGIRGTASQQVTVRAANVEPTAAFSASTAGLRVEVDGSGSSDPDGRVAEHEWAWGDGSERSYGAAAGHSYASPGDYTVTLTVTDDRGGQATTSRVVSVTHADPVADFSASATRLRVEVDASASSSSDGASLAYAWGWGDGSAAGSGVTAGHDYAEPGTYTVTLTLTDSVGASATTTREVTVTEAAFAARDDFSRSVTGGWGDADVGGTWARMQGSVTVSSVAGTGNLALPAGQSRTMTLQGLSIADTETTVTASLDQGPATGGSYFGTVARVNGSDHYAVRAWLRTDGRVWLVAQRGSTVMATQPLSQQWSAGEQLQLRVEVSGSAPTTIRAMLWELGDPQPASWQLTMTDATAALQGSGSVGLHAARGGASTSIGTFAFDTLRVTDLAAPTEPADPVDPVAAFDVTASGLEISVDGRASTDADGTVASHAWSWGDGTPDGSGATAEHAYAEAGTYAVRLTVTDDDGRTATTTRSVTVERPAPAVHAIADDFDRTVAPGWGTAGIGGQWSMLTGTAAPASVADGAGRLTIAPGSTRNLVLAQAPLRDVRITADLSLDQAPATGAAYLGVLARASASDDYRVRVWMRDNGTVWLVAQQGGTVLQSVQLPGIVRQAGAVHTLEVEVTGGATTTISARLWAAGTTPPSNWQLTAVDATGLDSSGAVGVHVNRSGSASTTGLFTVDNLRVVDLG